MVKRLLLAVFGLALCAGHAWAQGQLVVPQYICGTSATGAPIYCAVSSSNPLPTTISAGSTGGDSTWSAQGGTGNALITNSAIAAVTGAHSLKNWDFYNSGSTACFVQVFDLASASVTLGTTVPKWSVWVPATGAWDHSFPDEGVAFANAITFAATTTTNGSTQCNAGIAANISYK